MTGGVSLSHITFLHYRYASRRYRDIVAMRHDAMRRVAINVAIRPTLRRVATLTSRQKRRFPPDFLIVLSRRPNVTTRRKLNQSNHNVAINVMIRPKLRRVVTSTSRQKRRFPPDFPIVLSRRPNVTTRRESNQSNHNVVIKSQLHRDYVTMRHDEISTSRFRKN